MGAIPMGISGISRCSTGRKWSIFSQPHGNGDTKQETTHEKRLSRRKALAGRVPFLFCSISTETIDSSAASYTCKSTSKHTSAGPLTFYASRNQPQQTVVDAFGEAQGEKVHQFVAHFFLGQSFVVFEEAEF